MSLAGVASAGAGPGLAAAVQDRTFEPAAVQTVNYWRRRARRCYVFGDCPYAYYPPDAYAPAPEYAPPPEYIPPAEYVPPPAYVYPPRVYRRPYYGPYPRRYW